MVAPPGVPPMPEGLPEVAQAKWAELVPLLMERRTLALEDGSILEAYCRAYASWKQYQALVEQKPVVRTPFGPKVNPAAGEARKWETRMTAMGDRLGLNASARSRVSTPEKKKEPDAAEAFLFQSPRLVSSNGQPR